MNKYIRLILDKEYRFSVLSSKGFYNKMSDKAFLEKKYRLTFHRKIDWENPKTFNEKLQWLKIYNRNPLYTSLVDKAEVKAYVEKELGKEYIIPTLGVYSSFEEIDFSKLPNSFVIKTTHDSGGVVICKDKSTIDFSSVKDKIKQSLKRNYYYSSREWPYKNVVPKIIIEKYMEDDDQPIIDNWKFFSTYGNTFMYYVAKGGGHSDNLTLTYYDMEDKRMGFQHGLYDCETNHIDLPEQLVEMKRLASKLSKKLPFVRVDFYIVNGHVYFGELTFFPDSGLVPFRPDSIDYELGKIIKLPSKYSNE